MGGIQEKWSHESPLVVRREDNLGQSLSHMVRVMLRYEPQTVIDAIEIGIAVFDSGVAKGVDGIQRHYFV